MRRCTRSCSWAFIVGLRLAMPIHLRLRSVSSVSQSGLSGARIICWSAVSSAQAGRVLLGAFAEDFAEGLAGGCAAGFATGAWAGELFAAGAADSWAPVCGPALG